MTYHPRNTSAYHMSTSSLHEISSKQLSAVFDISPDAIVLRDPLDRILFWNQGAEQLYGWTEAEALGKITHHLLVTEFPISRAVLDATLEQQGSWKGALICTSQNGSRLVVKSCQILVRDKCGQPQAILEINRKQARHVAITQRTRRHLAERETLLRVLDALPVGVYLVAGEHARLLLANHAAQRIWGAYWPRQQRMDDFLRTNCITLLDAQGRPLTEEQFATIRALRTGKEVQHQSTVHRRDGTRITILVSATPLDLSLPHQRAKEPVVLVVYSDITALKEAEALKDEFLSLATHELRTPLTGLKGYTDRILQRIAQQHDPPLSDWQQKAMQEIKQATDRLTALSADLLDVTRMQAEQLSVHSVPINVVELVQHLATSFQQTTTAHRIEVQAPSRVLIVEGDPMRLEQIVRNLLDNAVKYSPQGGPITITLHEQDHQIEVAVQDWGIGIPEHQHARIFSRFMRAENATAKHIEGTGLGLYLCRGLTERMGGHLWFTSVESQGSTFFLSLPGAHVSKEPIN